MVVWRTDLYKQEAFRQLVDTKFYAKVNKDLTQANQKTVKETPNATKCLISFPNVAILTASCLKHSIVSKTSIENRL